MVRALCNNSAVHGAGRRAIRCYRAGLLIVVLALAAPAMNLAMGAMSSNIARPATAVTEVGPAHAVADADSATAEGASGTPLRVIQKARGVLAPTVVLSDTTAVPSGAASGRPPLAGRPVAVPAAPRTAGHPHRGPPRADDPRPQDRRPHGHL